MSEIEAYPNISRKNVVEGVGVVFLAKVLLFRLGVLIWVVAHSRDAASEKFVISDVWGVTVRVHFIYF